MKKSRIGSRRRQSETPVLRHLPLVDILVDTQTERQALVVASECSDAPREVCELALAHVNSDRVEAAYRRSDLFERRRELMESWATYIAEDGRHG